MTEQLQALIDSARKLSPREQLELIGALSQLLRGAYGQSQPPDRFWSPLTLDELVEEQQVRPIMNLRDLRADFWPVEEPVDEFIRFVYQQRLEDRVGE
jgi:hypothetical protein